MKKFKFKLKALLSYREHIEKVAKEEVAKVQMEINRCVNSIKELETIVRMTANDIEEKMSQGVTAQEHVLYSDYLKSLKIKVAVENDLLGKLKRILQSKQEELTKKSVSRKILENLKDKKKKEYYDAIDKQTMKEADEMVLIAGRFNKGG